MRVAGEEGKPLACQKLRNIWYLQGGLLLQVAAVGKEGCSRLGRGHKLEMLKRNKFNAQVVDIWREMQR